MATLKEIGEELGLSPATVSRALNGFPEVGAKTRKRVQDMAAKLNYRPNQIAKKLVTGRSGMIGMILKSAQDAAIDPSFFDFVAGLSTYLAQADMDLVFHVSTSDDLVAPYRRLVSRNTLDGFILNAPLQNDPRIAFLKDQNVPFALHGRDDDDPTYPFYDINNYQAGYVAATLLLDLGHKRIAVLNGPANYAYSTERERGINAALAAKGLSLPETFIARQKSSERLAEQTVLKMLSRPLPPTAIITSSTLSAAGAISAARKHGLNIGTDLSLIAHDDAIPQWRALDFDPPLTVTRSPLRAACGPLAQMIATYIDGEPVDNLQITAEVDLIVRGSTGPAPEGGREPWVYPR